MADEIRCIPLKQLTDGPLFGSGPGTLSALTNMELQHGGYAEARGGFEELKPSGGTGADAISAGGYSAALQLSTSYGWVRSYDDSAGAGSQYTGNLHLQQGGFSTFGPTAALEDAIYWGSDAPFSRIGVSLSVAANWSVTLTYEYWNGSTWGTLTTAETIDWTTSLRVPSFASWTMPTNWAASTRGDSGTGNVLKYWMRIRISAFASVTTTPLVAQVRGFWGGMRELYVATQSPRTSATAGTLKRHGQTGTTTEWFAVNSALYSGNASPSRMAEYRGRVMMINGKEQKRWDGATFKDIGLEPFVYLVGNHNLTAQAGGVLGAGIWRYYAAYGEGPCQNTLVYADRQDAKPLYGVGQAAYITEVTTVAAQRVRLEVTGVGIPAGVSSFFLFRTDDLTNVPVADRGNAPAYLVQSFRIQNYTGNDYENGTVGQALGNAGEYYYDDAVFQAFPLQEALAFDVSPPARCKYLTIYQNRLLLGDDEKWYVSDPFLPDRFSTKDTTGYISLARAQGGRHMGGVEFGDQAVLFTEDQTWGLTNVDLDVPQLFQIALGVGCVAPDGIEVVDGVLIWPARDGFYGWTGAHNTEPKKLSDKMDATFGKLSFENHGGSKSTGHNRRYDIRLSSPDYSGAGAAFRYNLDSGEWSTIAIAGINATLFPLTTVYAPLGNNDVGVLHPLWGKVDYETAGFDWTLFLGELSTRDDGTSYTCSAWMFFPQEPGGVFTPNRVIAYYQASNGWGTPTFGFVPADVIGTAVGTLNTGTADTGTDYSVIGATFSQVGRGTSDLKISFSVLSAAGGTVNGQRLFGAVLEGSKKKIRRGGV